jgi:outer membrane protein
LESAQARVIQAKSEYKPTIDLFVRYSSIGRGENNFRDASRDYVRDRASIGVQLKWNLFDGNQKDQRVTQAHAVSEQMRLRMEQLRRDLQNDYQEKLSREADMHGQFLLAKKQLEFAQSQLKIARKRWETNLISMLQFHAAQLSVEDARSKVASIETDFLMARVATQLAHID